MFKRIRGIEKSQRRIEYALKRMECKHERLSLNVFCLRNVEVGVYCVDCGKHFSLELTDDECEFLVNFRKRAIAEGRGWSFD